MAAVLSIGLFAGAALAHDHHEGEESHIPEGETVSAEPLVSSSVYEVPDHLSLTVELV
jgi:hypothetical protein